MKNPALVPYFPVLNALDEMQRSKIYAVRAPVLAEAETTIVRLATDLAETKAKLLEANSKLASIEFIAEATA